MRNYFKSGTFNVICDVCGFKFKSDQVMKRWDNLMVCKRDYEVRHPADLIRVRSEYTAIPFVRHEPDDQFITVSYGVVGTNNTLARADYGTADFAIVGNEASPV